MTKIGIKEVTEGIDKLAKQFGDKHYGDDRRDLIFNYVKMIPSKDFEGIIENMLATFKMGSPPLPKDFENAAKIVRNRIYDESRDGAVQRRAESNRPDCYDCSDLGLAEAQERESEFCVHFKCHCKKGDEQKYIIPKWSKDYYGSYILLQAWPDRIKKWMPSETVTLADLISEYSARLQMSEEYWEYQRTHNG